MSEARASNDDFYVGYAAAPGATKAVALTAAPLLVLIAAAFGYLFAVEQADTGTGEWRTALTVTLEGELVADPYPALLIPGEAGGPAETVFLTTAAKLVPLDRMEGLVGGAVAATGILVERDGKRVLAVNDGAEAIVAGAGPLAGPQTVTPLGRETLRGEIIDPKCWHGVMKPGEGKTHKACATLCLFGGMAPLFKTTNEAGVSTTYLMTDSAGRPVTEDILKYVADPVAVSGALERRGDVIYFKIEPASIMRL